jgi:hypothetical protein
MGSGMVPESVDALERHPTAAFSFAFARSIDINGTPGRLLDVEDLPDQGFMDGLEYLHRIAAGHYWVIRFSTVMLRSSALRAVGSFENHHACDPLDLNLFYRLDARAQPALVGAARTGRGRNRPIGTRRLRADPGGRERVGTSGLRRSPGHLVHRARRAYWGPPPDDETAIQEVERLRRKGAAFMIFGWPAFWWIDHYGGLRDYLYSTARCVVNNSRLLAFEMHG